MLSEATKAHYGPSVTALFEQPETKRILADGYGYPLLHHLQIVLHNWLYLRDQSDSPVVPDDFTPAERDALTAAEREELIVGQVIADMLGAGVDVKTIPLPAA